MKISSSAIRHPVVVGMVLIALAVFGIFSVFTTNVEFMGRIEMPQLFVIAVWPGASSQDIEEKVVNVMEENFVTIPDFRSMTSTSSNSYGVCIITFADGIEAEDKINEVRNRIREFQGDLPDDMATPSVMIGGASLLPILTFAAYVGDDIGSVSRYLEEELLPQITRIEGVSTVELSGTASPQVNVKLRIEDMEARGVSSLAVYQALSYAGISMPLGSSTYQGKSVNVRFDGSFTSLDDLRDLPVGASEEGQIIRLGDVADVELTFEGKDYYITKGDENLLVCSICKRNDGNSIKIADEVRAVLEKSEAALAGAIHYEMISEDKSIVTQSMSTVIESGVMGILIAVLIIFLFLNDTKATLVIGCSIPLSIFFTFIGMRLMGISVNLLSISGIVVALGSIVDASIVVLDESYRFYQKMENGRALYSVTTAIDEGSDKVGLSVIGSNLTTVVVFVPLAVISGLIGSIIRDLAVTFMVSILASLVVAIVFVPWLMKLFLREEDDKRVPARKSLVVRGVEKLEKGYGKTIGGLLKDPFLMVLIAVGVLLITLYTLPKMNMGFIPSTDNSDMYINISFPYGYNVEDTRKGMRKVEDLMLSYVTEGTLKTYVTYSGTEAGSAMSFSSVPYEGGIHMVLCPVKERDYDIHDLIQGLQYEIAKEVPDASVEVVNGGFDRLVGFVTDGGGFGINLIGSDSDVLYRDAERIMNQLLQDPEVMSAALNATYDNQSAVMNVNYDNLSSLGISSYEAAMTNAILFNGMDVGTYRDVAEGSLYNIHLSSNVLDYPVDESVMTSVKIAGHSGDVPLSSLADLEIQNELSQINHSDRVRSMSVTAKLTSESPQGVQARLMAWLEENPLSDGVELSEGGLGSLISEMIPSLASAMAIAIFLVYFVMVMVFERFNQPLQVMITLPFCLVGVTISLAFFGSSLNMVSIVGVISLFGMLVNNGIILIDSINDLMREGRSENLRALGFKVEDMTEKETLGHMTREREYELLFSSTVSGTVSRLRPILMSSLTTILGVVPMAVAAGEGAEIYAPLGQVIMGGLMTSMLITLFITPVIYYMFEKRRIKKTYGRNREGNHEK